MTELIQHPELGITYRKGTFDEWILNETKSYFPLGLDATDRVLDLGGHIGCFGSRALLERPGTLLWSFEAEASNYRILEFNATHFKFGAFYRAVVPDELEGKDIKIYVNDKTNNALHSTIPTRGRSEQVVVGIGLRSILKELRPTIVKCDIEGAEYDLPWDQLNKDVRYVVMELHLTKRGHRDLAARMLNTFEYMGFRLLNTPRIGEKNWTTIAKWRKDVGTSS